MSWLCALLLFITPPRRIDVHSSRARANADFLHNLWTCCTSGSEPEVGVHLDVDEFYCTCALEQRGKSKAFQKRQLPDGLMVPGSAEQSGRRCVRLLPSKVASFPCPSSYRAQQAIPVPVCAARTDLHRRRCLEELAAGIRVAGSTSNCVMRTSPLAPIPRIHNGRQMW